MKRLIKGLKILPRWIIMLIDLMIIFGAVLLGYALRFNFIVRDILNNDLDSGILLTLGASIIAIFITQSYAGIIRFTSLQDGLRIVYMCTIGTLIVLVVNLMAMNAGLSLIPRSVIIISYFNSIMFLFSYRLLVKYVFSYFTNAIKHYSNVVIFGAGEFGIITKQVINQDTNSNLKVVAFLDDDPRKIGKVINGARVFKASTDLPYLIRKYYIDELIITISDISLSRKNDIVDFCLKHNIKVRLVPQADSWVKGELSLNQIKDIKIEELLGRESVKLNNPEIEKDIKGKCVMITGAGGSIGSEMVRQVLGYNPETLLLVDQGETPLYEIDHELKDLKHKVQVIPIIADVASKNRIERIFSKYRPEIVFHAAAYKHVPMMENNPVEAVICNVLGTKTLADLSVKYKVKKFVMISTDKAVNPTNVMGASKRVAEIYVQSLNHSLRKSGKNNIAFVTTRFGNVLGSNGSVIPLFKNQIAKGGPVTVTHPKMTRYFMTIPEACQLSLEAGIMGNGCEIFIIDMGKSVKIVDLAKKMIQLSGFRVGEDIKIEYTGLRPGEKLYEELLNNKENTIPTHHPKIMIAKIREQAFEEVKLQIAKIIDATQKDDEFELVSLIKNLVPEYKSNSSRFEKLDNAETVKIA
ncbi:nucleoside-diphosphate sugar epimerase/dehydratase [Fulvivirgaceae bacterium BMA10]|uniref:Nucleoside-diphosphate sugar epimerase/dehydratase n=1 Tax=Splendidivirga corallicola TaxID=3051826 RepID=A0ABT8KQY1_9BACT|nr:nucleoside-diphosphate sugar epimerase/dehydratase [Fulvivirgaceae bacterium BMA10]